MSRIQCLSFLSLSLLSPATGEQHLGPEPLEGLVGKIEKYRPLAMRAASSGSLLCQGRLGRATAIGA
jgi:hypothetical protein